MARCPACFRRIRLFDLIQQRTLFSYACAKCGRAWQVTHFTVALAVVLSAIPIIYAILHFPLQPGERFVAFGEALAAAITIYFLSLLFFARLEPRRHRRWRL